MSLDLRKEKCRTSVSPLLKGRFGYTMKNNINNATWYYLNWKTISNTLLFSFYYKRYIINTPSLRDLPKSRWRNMCLKDLNPKSVRLKEEQRGLLLIVLQSPIVCIHFEIMSQLDAPKLETTPNQPKLALLEQFLHMKIPKS